MRLVFVVALLVLAHPALADERLVVDDASTTLTADGTTLHLTVRNAGDAPVHDVRPAVHHQSVTHDGAPLDVLTAGNTHDWMVSLARPAEPGSIPAVIEIGWTDDHGTRHMTPHVVAIETPGLPPPDVTLAFESTPIVRYGRATMTLHNRGAVPIHGRVVVILPSDLVTEPVSQAADVTPGQRIVLPVIVQRETDTHAGSVDAFAFFDYGLDGRRHVVVSRTTVDVRPMSGSVSPLIVGGIALGMALTALAIAWRIAARRRAAAPA